ncbi:MAG: hypothetical protein WAV09_03860, partial [Minisyncoccia bacterium]
ARIVVKDQRGALATNQNQNTNNQNTTTNTTPTDCKQYEGVIPGETRKLRVVQGNVNVAAYSPNGHYGAISPEGLRDLKAMYGDIGYGFSIGGASSRNRISIPSGTVFAFKFKTSEYNYPPYAVVGTYDHPGTLPGVIGYSVSECPGDFTSPAVLAQKSGNDVRNVFGDGMWRDCVSYNASIQSTITFGVGAGPYKCNLEPNKTYYLNVTAGFIYDERGSSTAFPYMQRYGHDPATGDGRSETSIDILTNNFGTQEASRQVYGDIPNPPPVEMIKNRSAAYAELARFQREFGELISESSAKRQACYGRITVTDRNSSAYRAARLACLNDNNPPLPPFTGSENY